MLPYSRDSPMRLSRLTMENLDSIGTGSQIFLMGLSLVSMLIGLKS